MFISSNYWSIVESIDGGWKGVGGVPGAKRVPKVAKMAKINKLEEKWQKKRLLGKKKLKLMFC